MDNDIIKKENFYRSVFDEIPNLILIINEDGVILNCNKIIEPLLGFTPEEVTNKGLDNLVKPDYQEKIQRKINSSKKDDSFYDSYMEFSGKTGEKIEGNIQIAKLPGNSEADDKIILLFEEITERQLEKLKAKLARIRKKNRDLEELVQTIFHDLQEPIRSIGSYMDILRSKYNSQLPEDANARLIAVKNNAKRMEALMDDLSELSRLGGSRSLQLLNIEKIIEELAVELEKDLGNFELNIKENFPKVHFDPSQMEIILRNLIRNGIRFNDQPRKIFVGYERTPPGENLKLFVKDNGRGIQEEYKNKVFEMFKVLEPEESQGETGAGLAICKRIVEDNGGEIWLDSEEGSGTVVYFTVPIYEEDQQGREFFTQFSLSKKGLPDSSPVGSGLFDEESGLHNRRYFDQILESHLKRYCKNGHEITFLVLKFSSHQKVKSTLKEELYIDFINQLTGRLKNAIRQSDLILRLSEKLFLIILPRMSGSIGEVKERIDSQISHLNSSSEFLDRPVKLRYGSSVISSEKDPDPEEAIKLAERNLYRKSS